MIDNRALHEKEQTTRLELHADDAMVEACNKKVNDGLHLWKRASRAKQAKLLPMTDSFAANGKNTGATDARTINIHSSFLNYSCDQQ
jgi:hypothetical protein